MAPGISTLTYLLTYLKPPCISRSRHLCRRHGWTSVLRCQHTCFPYIVYSTTVLPLMNVAMQNADGIQHASHPIRPPTTQMLACYPCPMYRSLGSVLIAFVGERRTCLTSSLAGRNRFADAVRHRQPIPTKQLPSTSSEINESAQHIECEMRYHRFFRFDLISKSWFMITLEYFENNFTAE